MHPEAFHIGSLTVHWYGVMVALGFLIGLWNASRRAMRIGIASEKVFDVGTWLIIGGIVGGRLFYVITYWSKLMENPLLPRAPWTEIFMVQRGGLVYYGGLIGAVLAGIFYARRKKLPVWTLADILTPGLALGYAIGRLGCLFNGCCYGRVCDVPWAIRFPTSHETHGAPVHPTQIYESLLNLGLYVAMAWYFRRRKFDGQVFAIYLMCYAAARSFVEIFRDDYTQQHIHGGLTPAQLISMGIFGAGLILLWKLPRKTAASA